MWLGVVMASWSQLLPRVLWTTPCMHNIYMTSQQSAVSELFTVGDSTKSIPLELSVLAALGWI